MTVKVPELNCNACKKRTQLNSMKYAKDGSGLVCEDCLNKQLDGKAIRMKTQVPSYAIPGVNTRNVDGQKKKVDYTCKSCSFKFSRAIDFRGPKLCPNCGKDSILFNLPNDADDLLKALDKMDDV